MIQWQDLTTYVQQLTTADYSGHDWDHIQRVQRLSAYLATQEKVPADQYALIKAAALTHDVLDHKLAAEPELIIRRQVLQTHYQKAGFTATQRQAIFDIIEHLSFAANLQQHYQLSLAGQIVQDADRLDALGAIGIGRALYYGAKTKAPMYDPNVTARTDLNAHNYRRQVPVLTHFEEKLFKLPALMNTKSAQQLAQERVEYMHHFVQEFQHEWHFGEK